MEQGKDIHKIITDFIYDKPDVVVKILQQSGYSINMKKATLFQISDLVWKALYTDENQKFAKSLDLAIKNEGQENFIGAIIGATVGLASAFITASATKDIAAKQREQEKQIALTNFAFNEKLAMEKLRVEQENNTTNILANTLLEYRKTLQTESTTRLKDTGIYVAMLGVGLGVFYGLYLLVKKD
jgi:gas vesicle protein